jgi:hypothetical protein
MMRVVLRRVGVEWIERLGGLFVLWRLTLGHLRRFGGGQFMLLGMAVMIMPMTEMIVVVNMFPTVIWGSCLVFVCLARSTYEWNGAS